MIFFNNLLKRFLYINIFRDEYVQKGLFNTSWNIEIIEH